MAKTKSTAPKTPKDRADARVQPVIDALQQLAREYAKQDGGRERLMKYTGLAPDGLDTLLYQGKGSTHTWLNVFLCVFGLSPDDVTGQLGHIEASLKKALQTDPADKRWFDITRGIDRDTKHYWLSIIEHALSLKRGAGRTR